MSDEVSTLKRIAIRGRWVVATEGGGLKLLRDHWVVTEGKAILAVTPEDPGPVDERLELEQGLVLPGFVNIHCHAFSCPLFRGIPHDMAFEPWIVQLIYKLMMPIGNMADDYLTRDEIRAILELALVDFLKGGSTTIADMWPLCQDVFLEVADEIGIRAYGVPYLMSQSRLAVGGDGKPVYDAGGDEVQDLTRILELVRHYNGTRDGRVKIILGPHGTDTCAPELLRAVREAADESGALVMIHLSQTEEEVALIQDRHGCSPVEHLHRLGLLGPDLIAAHCLYTSESDLALMKETGTVVANCTTTYARAGINAPLTKFLEAGLRTGTGTDCDGMDFINELRLAGYFGKLHVGKGAAAPAWTLLRNGTLAGADALARPDLGRLEAGAKADLLVVDMAKPHLQPVWDPVKTLIWRGNGSDISAVLVDGEILVRDGRYLRRDEGELYRRASAAAAKVWERAQAEGTIAPPQERG